MDELDAFLFELFALIEFDAAILAQIEEQRRIFADRLAFSCNTLQQVSDVTVAAAQRFGTISLIWRLVIEGTNPRSA
jgi:hypothetical protein